MWRVIAEQETGEELLCLDGISTQAEAEDVADRFYAEHPEWRRVWTEPMDDTTLLEALRWTD